MSSYGGYIERLARKVEARLQDIETIYNFDLGDEFEVAICALLEDILPAKYGVCRGFVVAENGDKAGNDLIIYDKMSSPTLRSSISRQFPVKEQIPGDAVYAYIECIRFWMKRYKRKQPARPKRLRNCCSHVDIVLTRVSSRWAHLQWEGQRLAPGLPSTQKPTLLRSLRPQIFT
ncbi:hypothetical protein SAMN05444064_1013 [Pseudomonas syringae]|uniref:DUF6602 domain-containing protein n=1 Tax=Pseudomonas syringae TaxID=317 RepID=UPI000898A993|nr:DUF6602 domain-containing protein [Pseudomonas syringae]SDW00058.1 hypothetical protein SAMN05444514_1015 [Pseudomonas syringae]SFL34398.1 hypothetical protein SAMN05444064_1013 [Pseudomonas syringae]